MECAAFENKRAFVARFIARWSRFERPRYRKQAESNGSERTTLHRLDRSFPELEESTRSGPIRFIGVILLPA
jgi:hypothetical protein